MDNDRKSTTEAGDTLRWLDEMSVQVGDPMLRQAADQLRYARAALREIGERAGVDRGAEWCRDRANKEIANAR